MELGECRDIQEIIQHRVDLKGEEPGDFFYTKDNAAKDFGWFYNPVSIIQGREYGSSIYEIKKDNGEILHIKIY